MWLSFTCRPIVILANPSLFFTRQHNTQSELLKSWTGLCSSPISMLPWIIIPLRVNLQASPGLHSLPMAAVLNPSLSHPLCLLGYSSTDGIPALKYAPTQGLCTCCSLLTILFLKYLHGSPLQFIKVSAQRPSFRTLFPDQSTKITNSLCFICLPKFYLFLRHHIHLFIHLLSVFCNTPWVPSSIPQCLDQCWKTEIIYKCELSSSSFSHSPSSLISIEFHFRR